MIVNVYSPQPNPELSDPAAFQLPHSRPGTLALSLSENDEEPGVRERPGYRPTEFLITTGPGPVPRLDGSNIVFGRVLSGIDVVAAVAQARSAPDFGLVVYFGLVACCILHDACCMCVCVFALLRTIGSDVRRNAGCRLQCASED